MTTRTTNQRQRGSPAHECRADELGALSLRYAEGTATASIWRRRGWAAAVGQQSQAQDQGRGEVAEAGLEAVGHAVGAGGGGRGDQPGEGGSGRPARPATRSGGSARGRGRGAGPPSGAAASRGQTMPGRGGGRAGTSPTRPGRRSGSRATLCPSRPPERLLGRGQRDRTEMLDPGQRVAGVDEVAQVPVAAAGQRGEPGAASARQRVPAGRDRASPTTNTAAGSRKLSLVPAARPAASPATTSAPVEPSRSRPTARLASVGQRVTAIATAASRKKIPTMSLRASPA